MKNLKKTRAASQYIKNSNLMSCLNRKLIRQLAEPVFYGKYILTKADDFVKLSYHKIMYFVNAFLNI